VSLAGAAMVLQINFKTVAKKRVFLGEICEKRLASEVKKYASISAIQFDERPTIEHTKCNPLSVAVAVVKKERKTLGFRVSKMPATGHLAEISRKKYGKRPDQRTTSMAHLFRELSGILTPNIAILLDECSFYYGVIITHFLTVTTTQYAGKKSRSSGQGEIKKVKFNPILGRFQKV
jgi:hypothetical protein